MTEVMEEAEKVVALNLLVVVRTVSVEANVLVVVEGLEEESRSRSELLAVAVWELALELVVVDLRVAIKVVED